MAIDRHIRIPTLLALLLLQASPCSGNELITTVGVTPSFFSGSYGRATKTDIFYLPFHIKVKSKEASFRATIPYIRVRSRNAVLAGGTVVGTTTGQATTRSGLGDIWLQGNYKVRFSRDSSFTPYVKIKLGTASRTQGLGTGKNDYEFGSSLQTRFGETVFPFARLGYRIMGSPSGLNLRNIFTYQAGVSYMPTHMPDGENIATLMFYGHQSTQPGFAAAAALIGVWDYKPQEDLGIQLFGLLGLSKGSPDYGAGINLKYSF